MQKLTSIEAAALLLLCASAPNRADAQDATGQITIGAGVATDQRGVRSNAFSVAPNFTLAPSSRVAIQVGGNATRFASQAFSLGAGGSVTAQDPIGRFAALTLTGSVNASRLQSASKGTFAQADLLPALEVRLGPVALFGGVRGASGVVTEASRQPGLPLGPSVGSTSTSRAGAGPVFGGVFALGDEQKTLRLAMREDHLRIDGVTARERTLSATLSVAFTQIASFDLSAGRYDGNRLIGTLAGDYLSAGISFRVGGAREPALPAASGAKPLAPGATRLTIRAPDAQRVEIAGDFTEWTPRAAIRAPNGVWYADLTIPPGQYRYAFRVDGSEWRVPDGATAVDDGFGGKSAWLTVSNTRSR